MIEIRYKRILIFQSIFLIALAIFTSVISYKNPNLLISFVTWIIAIILNVFYLKHFVLPRKSFLKKINLSSPEENLSWAEIEESILRKDASFNKQKEEFELENLKYKRLLDSLQDPVCIINDNLLVIYVNHSFRALFNFPNENLPLPLIEVSRNFEFQEFLRNSIKNKTPSKKNYFSFNQLQDPYKSFFDLKIFPVDEFNNYLCLLHDVTERKMADQMREDFVSNFSHEVRTPLTILTGQMQSLKMVLINEPDFNTRFLSYFEKTENNSRRLINLFNDLLRLNSVESKKEITKEIIDIEEMINFLTQDLLTNYPDKKIQFNIDLAQKNFFIDYNLFEQVLVNLLDNSLKYSKSSGLINISSHHQDEWDYLTIADNGIGIPEEQIHRIFERFFRIDSSRSSKIEGTGLGLSIVKHIVQKHDGKIKAQGKEGIGTTFTLSFPSS